VLNSHPEALEALSVPSFEEGAEVAEGEDHAGRHSSKHPQRRGRVKGATSRTRLYKKTRSSQAASAFAQQLLSIASCVNVRSLSMAQVCFVA
jgi:hypothetical protein